MNLGEAVENFLTDKLAQYLRPVNHADVVVQCPPKWIRASDAKYHFGLKRDFLNNLVCERKVIAKKADKIVLYNYADIDAAICAMKDFKKGN